MRLRTQGLLLVVLIVGCAALFGVGMLGLQSGRIEATLADLDSHADAIRHADQSRVLFQRQISTWRSVLLDLERRSDGERSWAAYVAAELRTRDSARQLTDLVDVGLRRQADRFVAAHVELGRLYREARRAGSPAKARELTRGLERQPLRDLEALRHLLVAAHEAATTGAARQREQRHWRMGLFGLLGLLSVGGLALVCFDRWFIGPVERIVAAMGRDELSGEHLETQISGGPWTAAELRTISRSADHLSRRFRSAREEHERHAEALGRARVRAEVGSQAKTRFMANMSTEIRVPVNALVSALQVLDDVPFSESQRETYDLAMNNANMLAARLAAIHELAALESGLEVTATSFDIEALIEDIVRTQTSAARRRGIELYVESGDLPRILRGQEARLSQALATLVRNAVRFTDRGYVLVSARTLELRSGIAQLAISVRDTGCGIDSEHQRRIFETLWERDPEGGRELGGLGLAIVRTAIEQLGGKLVVRSEPGVGSDFSFTLSFAVERAGTSTGTPLAGHSVWLVASESCDALPRWLRSWGGQVRPFSVSELRQAGSSGQAHGLPDLVVLADQLPAGPGAWPAPLAQTPTIEICHLPSQIERELSTRFVRMGRPLSRRRLAESVAIVLGASEVHAGPEGNLRALAGTLVRRPLRGGRSSRGRVLIVEDNPVNRRAAEALVRSFGVEVELAIDGVEAVHMVRNGHFSMVLMDCQMPVMDGYEATRKIRTLPEPACSLPIIALTAMAREGDRERCVDAGMDDYLTKPPDHARLREVIERYVWAAAA